MEKILIIDCRSTSMNYINDIRKLGYEPLVMEVPDKRGALDAVYNYTVFGDKAPEVIHADVDYDKTLSIVKKINPKLIVPGNDLGIYLSLRLSKDLNLLSTPFENFEKMRNKYVCQNALKDMGIRYIKGKLVSSKEDALNFFNELGGETAVVKPIIGESSVGVYVCKNKKEFIEAVERQFLNSKNNLNEKTIFIQEYIDGDEYVVNSVSSNGEHKITSLWKYTKKLIPGYAPVYERLDFLDDNSEITHKLVQYDLKVLEAIGIKYGPTHCEFKVDKNGPVLIESNCRVPGGTMSGRFLDKVLGHHETNLSLKAYLQPEEFKKLPKINKLVGCGLIKFLILPYSIKATKIKLQETLEKLPSFFSYNFGVHAFGENGTIILNKTIDYDTCPGNIFLINKDMNQLNLDYKKIIDLEQNHIDQLFECKKIN